MRGDLMTEVSPELPQMSDTALRLGSLFADVVTLYHGDCLDVLTRVADASVDAVVTDPPYNLSFMGKDWDRFGGSFGGWCERWAAECRRVLKPGGHMLAFGGTRTWHRLACAVEDTGFEIRDSIAWLYGSGFPKSLDVSRAIDKAAGVAATDAAARWQGWGTALKPAHEPIVVARKPLSGTVAANVLAYGTGALNIDGCRVQHRDAADLAESTGKNRHADYGTKPGRNSVYGDYTMVPSRNYDGSAGRWPPNVTLDDTTADQLDTYGDSGGASRFFPVFRYEPKAPTAERPRVGGTAHPTVKPLDLMRWLVRLVTPPGGLVLDPFLGSGTTAEACILEGFRCVGIEQDADYLRLTLARLSKPLTVMLEP